MTKYINDQSKKLNSLIAYAKGILGGERGGELYAQYKDVIKKVNPADVILVVDQLVKTGEDMADIKRAVNKILNIFYASIKSHGRVVAGTNTFLSLIMAENREMENRMTALKKEVKQVFSQKGQRNELLKQKEKIKELLFDLKGYEKHYLKIENIFFPYFEKLYPDHLCVNVMWSMHDDARKSLNNLIKNLERDTPSLNEFNFEIGRLYFSVLPVIFREEFILYPVSQQVMDDKIWDEMLQQSAEIGYCFIDPPQLSARGSLSDEKSEKQMDADILPGLINLETGKLSIHQIIQVFNHLPVDMTFVDENDEVRFFNNSKDRHFTRSKAIIGRKVQNCHPPESIDAVNRIVDSFKSGKKDKEDFWIKMKNKIILIQYFAVRDEDGTFKGTLEVSQDITEIKQLQGEKRLLD